MRSDRARSEDVSVPEQTKKDRPSEDERVSALALADLDRLAGVSLELPQDVRHPVAEGGGVLEQPDDAVLLGLWLIEGLGSGAGGGAELAEYLSLVSHYYRNLNRGVLDLGDILYFVSLTGLSLFLGSKAIESRRWR